MAISHDNRAGDEDDPGGPDAATTDTAAPAAPDQRPRDAATLILLDRSTQLPRILMGRRRPTQIFLPDKFVFPGGRADPGDRSVPSADELREPEVGKLLIDMKGQPGERRARGLALAAIRETYEEAGRLVGSTAPVPPEASGLVDQAWRDFFALGCVPRLSPLTFLVRAITPPGRPRRYDTRFFLVEASEIAAETDPPDDELSEIGWYSIEEVRRLDLPNITRAVVEDLSEYLEAGPRAAEWRVPYYFFRSGTFERVLLTGREDGRTIIGA